MHHVPDPNPLPLGEGLCPVPDEPRPKGGGSGAGRAFSVQKAFSVHKSGMTQWGDFFTATVVLPSSAVWV